MTLHNFRHQFATRALKAGVSSFHLQAIGGWKSPVMLQRYGKVRNKALREQMAKLNGRIAPQAEAGASMTLVRRGFRSARKMPSSA